MDNRWRKEYCSQENAPPEAVVWLCSGAAALIVEYTLVVGNRMVAQCGELLAHHSGENVWKLSDSPLLSIRTKLSGHLHM